jgi:hypothetical protein
MVRLAVGRGEEEGGVFLLGFLTSAKKVSHSSFTKLRGRMSDVDGLIGTMWIP